MANWSDTHLNVPFNNTNVDNISERTGVIDSFPSLAFDIPDNDIVNNLDARIEDSRGYYDDAQGFNLSQFRAKAMKMYLNKVPDTTKLYRFQDPYQENQLYIAVESIVAYLTAQNPAPEVYPAQDNDQSKKFATDLEKAMMAHTEQFQLAGLVEACVRNVLTKKVAFLYLHYDPDYGDKGEIIPSVLDPEYVVVDKNAKRGEDPAFICVSLKMSASEICSRWPERKKEIYEELGIVRGTTKQMEQEIVVREVWITHYNKKFEAQQGVVYYFGNCVLEKTKNPNWIYTDSDKNFLPAPRKPIIPLNFDNDGAHWIDYTSPVEQAMPMQNNLNKRGRQMMELADKANGLLVVSTDSGITKDDLQNLTGDPNQRLMIKTNGMRTGDLVYQVPPPVVIPFLMEDKQDQRVQIHSIMGTPSEFTGTNDGNTDDQTLGQSVMKKNQASGRQDLFARAIDRFMNDYFNFWVQMACVWYDEKHWFVYNGGDGEFDYITLSRDLIDKGMAVTVKSGSNLPFDKQRQEAIGLQLAKMDKIAPLDLYKMLHIPNAQQVYDNWVKYHTAPEELARNAMEELDSSEAYVAFVEIMAGKKADEPTDPTKEFVLALRKLMLRDEFLKADKKRQKAFLEYVDKAVDSLELRTSLDVMSQGSLDNLKTSTPIQPYQPPQPPMAPVGGTPSAIPAPGASPGVASALPPLASAPGMPPGPNTTPGIPQPGLPPAGMPPMAGTPLMNPAAPQMPNPNNVTALPPV